MNYYYKDGDDEAGPVSAKELRQLVQQGVIKGKTRIRQEDSDKWVPASSVKGLIRESPPVQTQSRKKASPRQQAAPAQLIPNGSYPDLEAPHVSISGCLIFLLLIVVGVIVDRIVASSLFMFIIPLGGLLILLPLLGWGSGAVMRTTEDGILLIEWWFAGFKTGQKFLPLDEHSILTVNKADQPHRKVTGEPVAYDLVIQNIPGEPDYRFVQSPDIRSLRERRDEIAAIFGFRVAAKDATNKFDKIDAAPEIAVLDLGYKRLAIKSAGTKHVLQVVTDPSIQGDELPMRDFWLKEYRYVMASKHVHGPSHQTSWSIWLIQANEEDENPEESTFHFRSDEDLERAARFILENTSLRHWEEIEPDPDADGSIW